MEKTRCETGVLLTGLVKGYGKTEGEKGALREQDGLFSHIFLLFCLTEESDKAFEINTILFTLSSRALFKTSHFA